MTLDPYELALAAGGIAALLTAWLPAYTSRRPLSLPILLVAIGGLFFLLPLDIPAPDPSLHVDVVERAMTCAVAPTIVAISGSASPAVSFRLAQMGVRSFLAKPLRLEELERTIDDALARPPDLRPQVRAAVGRASIQDVEEQVRTIMVDEALARAGGNRRMAAKLLNISRQLLQHILRRRA